MLAVPQETADHIGAFAAATLRTLEAMPPEQSKALISKIELNCTCPIGVVALLRSIVEELAGCDEIPLTEPEF